jgi:hypothetical protein
MYSVLRYGKNTVLALAVAAMFVGGAFAAARTGPSYQTLIGGGGGTAHQTINTVRGPLFTTGTVGNMQTTTLLGGAGQGLLVNNGNGTSTLIGQGGIVTTVPTPR